MVSILIPAYNEAERIADTITAVRSLQDLGELVVIDDGSTDATAECADAAGADAVLRLPHRGKGAALQAGYELSRGDILLLLDADLGSSACEAQALLDPLVRGEADMTIATFPTTPGRGGGIGLVVKLARWGIRKLTGKTMLAPLSGQRAVRREVIARIGGFAAGWGAEIALTVCALRMGYRVQEVPTTMSHRVTGRSFTDIAHRGAQFAAAARVLAHLWKQG